VKRSNFAFSVISLVEFAKKIVLKNNLSFAAIASKSGF